MYVKNKTDICFSCLLELMTILGEYRENIAIVGGWVPYFLLEHVRHEHVGSLDIDMIIDFNNISDGNYRTILTHLEKHGYIQKAENLPFSFIKEVKSRSGEKYKIQLDLMAGEYGGTAKGHRHQRIQDLKAHKVRGGDLVFDHFTSVKISGKLPDGAENEVIIKVANVIPFLVMKGMALWDRLNKKDAYDIYFIIKNYPNGLEGLTEIFRQYIDNSLIQEGLGKIRAKFMSIDMIGPKWIVDFEEIDDEEEKARLQRDAFERINAFLEMLKIKPFSEGK